MVTAETGQTFTAPSATSAWVQVLKAVADVKKEKRETVSISGPEYFGFANPTVHKLVQELPNANRCHRYRVIDYAAKAMEAEAAERRAREERDTARSQDIGSLMRKDPSPAKADAPPARSKQPAPASAPAAGAPAHKDKDRRDSGEKGRDDAHNGASGGGGGSVLTKDDSNGPLKKRRMEGDAPERPKPPAAASHSHAPAVATASKSGVQTKLSFGPSTTSKADLRHILGEDTQPPAP